jgi:hypothetical protein
MKELINLKQYKMGRDLLYPDEWTKEVESNAINLLEKVNELLNELGIQEAVVSSGFRPAAINGKITHAAKRSYHMLGMAVDIVDNKNQDMGKLIASRPDLLLKHGLWLEDLSSTIGHTTNWVHLDCGVRQERPSRTFKP